MEIEVAGRQRAVEVRRADGGFEATSDGRSVTASLVAAPSGWWSLLLDGRSYEVALDDQPPGSTVYVNGVAIAVSRQTHRFGRRRDVDGGTDGPRRVVSPMPGRVVRLLVKPGDQVAARQGLVVVEAMKMENELRAPVAGTVSEVRVAEGAPVDANAVLIVIVS